MKKRLLAIVTMIAIVATMVCMGSMAVSAADEVKYEDPMIMSYSHTDWFDTEKTWAEFVFERDGMKVLSWHVGGNINGQGNWNRPHYGQEIVKTATEQYLRLYDQPETWEHYKADTKDSNFYYFTTSTSKSAGLEDALKVTMKVRKVGAEWEGATGIVFRTQVWDGSAWTLTTDYTDQLLAGPMNEWFEVSAEVVVPAGCASADSRQVQFHYGEYTGIELHIENITSYVPLDMANIPEVTPETATFDGSAPADITVDVDLKGYSLSPVKYNGVALKKGADKDYAQSSDKTQITFNKSWLATLANGDHEIAISTPGGDCTLTITVTNANPSQGGGNDSGNTDAPAKGGCGGIITATSAVLASMLLAGAVLVFKKKED